MGLLDGPELRHTRSHQLSREKERTVELTHYESVFDHRIRDKMAAT